MLEIAGSSTRYEVLRRIGAGGMGVVYEAEDKERGQKVALKTIANPDVEKVYQLKREFRVLADLTHPNLVALYDLVVDHESWGLIQTGLVSLPTTRKVPVGVGNWGRPVATWYVRASCPFLYR